MSNVTMGRNVGPLFMRTYGRSKAPRRVDAWFSPDYRKNAFSSTDVSDPSIVDANDSSVPLKKRKKKGSAKTERTAKKKAKSKLKDKDSDEENVFRPDPVPKTTVARRPPRQPTRKGTERRMLSSMSENEQSISAVKRGQKKARRLLSSSESEEDSLMKHPRVTSVLPGRKSTAKRSDSLENSAGPAIRSKYVTARRRVQSVKSRGPNSKPPVLLPSLTMNSSDDFARAAPVLPRAVTRRKRLPLQPPISLERTSSDISVGPHPSVRRTRAVLRESLNASSDDPSLSCHAPLFSSTPSAALARRLSQRLQDPSLSGIHFSVEDSGTDTEPPQPQHRPAPHRRLRETAAPQPQPLLGTARDGDGRSNSSNSHSHIAKRQSGADGHLAPTTGKQEVVELDSQSVVVVEEQGEVEVVVASQAASPSPMKPPSQLDESPTSREQGTGDDGELQQKQDQTSLELFSLAKEGTMEEDVNSDNEDDEQAAARSISQAASGFVTAETRLCSLVEALKERCRTTSPVVRLSRVHSLDTSSQILSAGETFSSCLDSQPAIQTSGRRRRSRNVQGAVPVLGLSLSCSEISTPRLDDTVPPALAPAAAPSSDKAKSVLEDSETEEEEERGAATRRVVGNVGEEEESTSEEGGQEASRLEALVNQLKARCISCQPVILLDTLRLSPFLLRHHQAPIPTTAPRAPSGQATAPHTDPESSASDSSTLPVSTTPGRRTDAEESRRAQSRDDDQPERRRPKRRRLSDSFSKVSGDSNGACSLSPERTLLEVRSKQPAGRVGTGRKACVSGLSANRWTRRDMNSGASRVQQQAHDSLDLGRPVVAKHGKEPLSNWPALPITPARAEQLNISSILAGLSPDASLSTHMWSRLKAALSVHKKKTAFITPRRLALSGLQSPAPQRLDVSQDMFASPSLASLARASHCLSQVSSQEDIGDDEKVYQECHQEGPLTFAECIPPARMKLCRKIGEGTFGEVFSTTNTDGQPVALKIIPVEGKQKVNGEDQKTFGEILHEIIISKELSSLDEKKENRTDGFIGLNDLHCVQGSYPKQLLTAWDKFDKQRGSENDRPDFFGEEQLFLILEFEFGGSDLENMNGKLSSLTQAKSILQQVTAALAVAEQALCFEHRDLHWGNVLVKTTKQKESNYILSGETRSIENRGVQVNIIDYSLSRLEIDGLTVSCDISADEELFMGQGDYQFDIYRKMREENSNSWSEYHPHTNVLWLHYLTDKLLGMKYKSSAQGAQARALKSSLRSFHQELLAFQSATDVLQRSSLFQ